MQNETQLKLKEIQKILSTDWDPIPGSPSDEYDSYSHQIYSDFLGHEMSEQELLDYLISIEAETMGLEVDAEKTRNIAQKLIAILGA